MGILALIFAIVEIFKTDGYNVTEVDDIIAARQENEIWLDSIEKAADDFKDIQERLIDNKSEVAKLQIALSQALLHASVEKIQSRNTHWGKIRDHEDQAFDDFKLLIEDPLRKNTVETPRS